MKNEVVVVRAGARLDPKSWTAFALAETINGLYKTEVIRRCGPWRNIDDVELATLRWVVQSKKLLEPLGYVAPMEFEKKYYDQESSDAAVV